MNIGRDCRFEEIVLIKEILSIIFGFTLKNIGQKKEMNIVKALERILRIILWFGLITVTIGSIFIVYIIGQGIFDINTPFDEFIFKLVGCIFYAGIFALCIIEIKDRLISSFTQ